jgi:hypothetical protein
LDKTSNTEFSAEAQRALRIKPEKWKHAETEHFILHFRRMTEAQKVAREVEWHLWFVASFLGATQDKYAKKSHVFIFEDEAEWQEFVGNQIGLSWAKSFAHGDDLYMNVRGGQNQGTGSFDSVTMAHETTHAVVSRVFPGKRWPRWLNEGFAEFMGTASVGGRKGNSGSRYQQQLRYANFSPEQLEKIVEYPTDEIAIITLYQSSEKLVRFMIKELPEDRFNKFIEAILSGTPMRDAVLKIYGDKVKDWDDFNKRFEKFKK